MKDTGPLRVAITCDVESDWGGRAPADDPDTRGLREGLPACLEVLQDHGVRGTFFINASVLQTAPEVLGRISLHGHEVASHSLHHRSLDCLTTEAVREELSRSRDALEDFFGGCVQGFRAPQGRVPEPWWELLEEAGYTYDSSIFRTVFPGRYQHVQAPAIPYRVGKIWEFPVGRLWGTPFPLGLRWVTALGLVGRALATTSVGDPVILYMHPFDLVTPDAGETYPLSARLWYKFRASQARVTLDRLLDAWQRAGVVFMTLQELASSKLEGHH